MKEGFDIVVLNYNNMQHIVKCLDAIVKFTSADYKLIVIDQNSKDGSREWLLQCPHIHKLILNNENNGAWEGRNQGVREGEHEWVMFFDSDTEIKSPRWDVDILKIGNENPSVGIIEARVKLYNGDYRFAGFASNAVRRKTISEIGEFDHHFLIGGDNDFWIRFAWSGKWTVKYCATTDIYHFCGGTIVKGILRPQAEALDRKYRNDMLLLKYSPEMLQRTLSRLNDQRFQAERTIGWRL